MTLVKDRAQVERCIPPDGHDLPVLGTQENPPRLTDWEALIDEGVQPALILGAERRTGGKR